MKSTSNNDEPTVFADGSTGAGLSALQGLPQEHLQKLLHLAKKQAGDNDSRLAALVRVAREILRPPDVSALRPGCSNGLEQECGSPEEKGAGLVENGDTRGTDEEAGIAHSHLIKLRAQRVALQHLLRNSPVPPQLFPAFHCEETYQALQAEEAAVRQSLKPSGGKGGDAHEFFSANRGEHSISLDVNEDHVRKRSEELRQGLESMATTSLDPETQLKRQVRLKQLKLVQMQRQLRERVLVEGNAMKWFRKGDRGNTSSDILEWSHLRRERSHVIVIPPESIEEPVKSSSGTHSNVQNRAQATAAHAKARAAETERLREARRLAAMRAIKEAEATQRRREAQRKARENNEMMHKKVNERKAFTSELLQYRKDGNVAIQQFQRRRRQRNEFVTTWHSKEKSRIGREHRARILALKSDDQEAYLEMVQNSKNTRLQELLATTDDLLQSLGQKVEQQRRAGVEAEESLENEEADKDMTGRRDLLAGQRKYNEAVHARQEEVTQPAILEGGKLRPYQMGGLKWLVSLYNNNLNGILADEMGLGKTIQTISLIAYLYENKSVYGPHMIVCPKAVLPNWRNEFARWLPDLDTVFYDGRPEERRMLRDEYLNESKFHVLLTHYDLVMRDKARLSKIHWSYIIVDEGHRLKNSECQLARALGNHYNVKHRLLLTGTPIQNNLQELWSLLNFILPSIFNSSESFDQWFGGIASNVSAASSDDIRLNEEEELLVISRLHQVIRPFLLRRKKAEVEKELPEKTNVTLFCDMSAWQKYYYLQIVSSHSVNTESGTKSRALMNSAMQLRKCCNHPYLFLDEGYNPDDPMEIVRASGKFELLDRLLPKLRRSGHRILMFSQMTKLMDLLGVYLEWMGYKFLRLDGATKTEQRAEYLDLFNEPDSEYFIFLLSTRAGGMGLNLQTADTVIMFDSDWNPQMDRQAEDRAHRIGQKKEVIVFVLVSVGSIEEEILKRAQSKRGIDEKVIQAGLFNQSSNAEERKSMLEDIFRRGALAFEQEIPSETEINRQAARNESEFELFESMDEERREKEKGEYPSRLLTEDELPDWLRAEGTEEVDEDEELLNLAGKKRRNRKEVIYDELLSDTRWTKLVEEGGDLHAEEEKQKQRKLQKRKKRALEAEELAKRKLEEANEQCDKGMGEESNGRASNAESDVEAVEEQEVAEVVDVDETKKNDPVQPNKRRRLRKAT